MVPTAAVALLFVVMFAIGGMIMMLGRRGQSGSIAYPYGRFTRETVGETSLDEADAIVAPRLVLVGLVYMLGAALMLVDQNSTWIAALIIVAALVSAGLLALTAVAALKVLNAAEAEFQAGAPS